MPTTRLYPQDLAKRLYEMRRTLGLYTAAVLVGIAGWWGYATWKEGREMAAQMLLAEALASLEKGVDPSGGAQLPRGKGTGGLQEALERLVRLRQEYPGSQAAEQSVLQTGNIYYHQGEYEKALQAYQEYLGTYPSGASSVLAGLGRAYALEGLGRVEEAAAVFRTVAERHRESHLRAEALMGLGRSLAKNGRGVEALETYRRIAEEYPGTPLARRADELAALLAR